MSEAIQPSIAATHLSVSYANGVRAISDANFVLGPASICALVGPNGSGKSTLFKTLMGFLKPAQGSATIGGLPVVAALKRGLVAYVPQSEEVDWTFPVLVEDVVMMGRYGRMGLLRIPSKEDRAAVDLALERVGMRAFRHRQIGELSGGQKKRVFLARAIAQASPVILLDEPFTGIDVQTENEIVALLRGLRAEGALIFVSTHNLGSVPEFCDHVVLFNRTVIAFGPTETTFTREKLAATFGGVLRHVRLGGPELHDDDDARRVTVLTDDERPLVFYGRKGDERTVSSTPPRKGGSPS